MSLSVGTKLKYITEREAMGSGGGRGGGVTLLPGLPRGADSAASTLLHHHMTENYTETGGLT